MSDGLIQEKLDGLACVVCDQIIEDAATRKKTLVGIFNQIIARQWPFRHPSLVLFLSLTGGKGPYEVKVVLRSDDETIGTVAEISGRETFDSPLDIVELSFTMNGLVFPSPGRYIFDVYGNEEYVTHRPFLVIGPK
ncbi:MAG: hypothetical protein ACFB20_07025 [Opitutales bacterium]